LIIVAIIFCNLILIYSRKLLLDKAIEMDVSIFTPSDFCVMGTNIYFEDHSQEGMEKEIR
jgi:hypothetical protein